MRNYILFIALTFCSYSFSQMRSGISQYMLNQQQFNPGFSDITMRYNASLSVKRLWMTNPTTPLSFFANGGYSFTKNHYVGGVAMQDKIASTNTIDIAGQYTYHVWLNSTTAIGLGIKAGFQQRSLGANLVYFDSNEPNLEKTSTAGFNLGTGMSIQSKNFDFGVSLPYIFDNQLNKKPYIYETKYNHFYSHLGYKMRINDDFILFPSAMVKGVKGSPLSMNFDLHFLGNQFFWLGGGYRSDNTVHVSLGVFMEKGLRLIYSYETSYFTGHKRFDAGHEISLSYARALQDNPFARRKQIKRKGGSFRRKVRR